MKQLGERLFDILLYGNESFFSLTDIVSKVKTMLMKGKPSDVGDLKRGFVSRFTAIEDKRVSQALSAEKDKYDRMKRMMMTGDPEFDQFRDMVINHDFFYDYSDDNSVWRRGEAQRKAIEECAAKHGGLYQTFWMYSKKIHLDDRA